MRDVAKPAAAAIGALVEVTRFAGILGVRSTRSWKPAPGVCGCCGSPWGILGATALVQAVVTALSGSVALLGDTLHNAADALTALPLGVAFVLGRRPPTRRSTCGYGRAEDLAGIAIVLTMMDAVDPELTIQAENTLRRPGGA